VHLGSIKAVAKEQSADQVIKEDEVRMMAESRNLSGTESNQEFAYFPQELH
jgi:hypothetical protein